MRLPPQRAMLKGPDGTPEAPAIEDALRRRTESTCTIRQRLRPRPQSKPKIVALTEKLGCETNKDTAEGKVCSLPAFLNGSAAPSAGLPRAQFQARPSVDRRSRSARLSSAAALCAARPHLERTDGRTAESQTSSKVRRHFETLQNLLLGLSNTPGSFCGFLRKDRITTTAKPRTATKQ